MAFTQLMNREAPAVFHLPSHLCLGSGCTCTRVLRQPREAHGSLPNHPFTPHTLHITYLKMWRVHPRVLVTPQTLLQCMQKGTEKAPHPMTTPQQPPQQILENTTTTPRFPEVSHSSTHLHMHRHTHKPHTPPAMSSTVSRRFVQANKRLLVRTRPTPSSSSTIIKGKSNTSTTKVRGRGIEGLVRALSVLRGRKREGAFPLVARKGGGTRHSKRDS